MPTNDFIGFASSGSANIASQADYAAAAEQGIGMQPGPASSKLANKAWRQGANMAAALGQIASARGFDTLDDGDIATLADNIDDTISIGTFNQMFFSQVSGSYTAPRTGVYLVTLKGGGGGGGGRVASTYSTGGGGGEGGTLIFYVTLTQGQSYSYTIGAGGAGGNNDASASGGTDGGSTKFNGSAYSVSGGTGGRYDNNNNIGGPGGNTYTVPTGVIADLIPGQSGQCGCRGNGAWCMARAMGGGNSGSTSTYGGGGFSAGGKANNTYDAVAGADGYILIEYAG